jgi:L-arabinose isomerase
VPLEVCPTITSRQPSLEIHPLSIGGREDPVRLRFTADAGPAVVAGLSDLGDRFRLTVNEVDVVEPDEDLPLLPVACAVWQPRASLPAISHASAEAWLMAGAPHHTVLSKAVDVEVLSDFAEMTGTEIVVIDEDTTPRAFQRELRWNAAYNRLAQGL